ncbi:hypothetical protein GCM10023214_70620 [Amycolatopsis dongchuanensis]|uniref:Uncharacterized protein n=1 Tax=Amycolatopsis dongchuanensis TaxID=1070866 RepID=A0ABP8VM11_9PSEU
MCFGNPGTSEMHFVAALDGVARSVSAWLYRPADFGELSRDVATAIAATRGFGDDRCLRCGRDGRRRGRPFLVGRRGTRCRGAALPAGDRSPKWRAQRVSDHRLTPTVWARRRL